MLNHDELPNNPEELKDIIVDLQNKYMNLEEKFRILVKKFFEKKSEKLSHEDDSQLLLFNEAELVADQPLENDEAPVETTEVKVHSRRKPRKEVFPSWLPETTEVHELTPDQRTCPCCGKARPVISEEVTRELDIVPEQVRVIKHIQEVAGPCDCEAFKTGEEPEVITAKKPPRMLPGIIAGVGLLAYIFISKFLNCLPFYRQEKRFERLEIEISRSNMCNWMISASGKCQDLLDRITPVGCGAHIRRKFYDAIDPKIQKSGSAHVALSYFSKIYTIEDTLRKDKRLSLQDFVDERKKQMIPILEEFYDFLQKKAALVPPKTALGTAVNYALNEWDSWIKYLDAWFLTPDNNYCERMVKPFVIGRKNWYFADTLNGAHASGTMFSIIHTAKENGLNPYWYLRHLFTELPKAETEDDLRKLLPMYISPEDIQTAM